MKDNSQGSGVVAPSLPLTLKEVELAAKAKLPAHIYEFYASGSDDEEALRRNVAAFNRYVNYQYAILSVEVITDS